ncbi:MucR family transcriptional regulator (plasmid) [Gluconobacter sphaericus]|uniref:MucR family transcriptional regulator n=1 Tax=Gluconobacter sphaericus TaxID=574987 RepID=UPI001922CD8E|nr:MucR family transcriptional regulator [Gluconobacter sphaericus]QQX92711.1 MucR family transcriptional regulator [Gluconobacter sphaericus]
MTHELTADIVTAFLSRNDLEVDQLPALIRSVYQAFQDEPVPEATAAPEPFVNPKKSVFPDYIICLEDGKKLKMLKRHLKTAYGMTPAEYREKWGLPESYPMVAPNYSEKRSSLAREIGLGSTVKHIPEGKRGRPKKTED